MAFMQKQQNIVIFGGSGFVGRYVVQRLAKLGHSINVVSRSPEDNIAAKPAGPVGQISFTSGSITNEDDIKKTIKNTDIVINLVGILYSKRKQSFAAVHARGAEHVAMYAKEAGVKRFIQMSALGVDKKSVSYYARSKLAGEEAVLAAFKNATIIRPSVIFGEEDNFFNLFAAMSSISPFLPLIGGGKTKFQPVYVCDVADAIVSILESPDSKGKIYELGGPEILTFKQVLQYILSVTCRKRLLLPIPFVFAKLQAFFLEFLPVPPLTRDQVNLLKTDNVVSKKALTLSDLNITPTPVDAVVPHYLSRFAKRHAAK